MTQFVLRKSYCIRGVHLINRSPKMETQMLSSRTRRFVAYKLEVHAPACSPSNTLLYAISQK